MLYEMESQKSEPKVSIEELNEAVEAAISRVEGANEAKKSL